MAEAARKTSYSLLDFKGAMAAINSLGISFIAANKALREALESFGKFKTNGRIKNGRIYFKRRVRYKR